MKPSFVNDFTPKAHFPYSNAFVTFLLIGLSMSSCFQDKTRIIQNTGPVALSESNCDILSEIDQTELYTLYQNAKHLTASIMRNPSIQKAILDLAKQQPDDQAFFLNSELEEYLSKVHSIELKEIVYSEALILTKGNSENARQLTNSFFRADIQGRNVNLGMSAIFGQKDIQALSDDNTKPITYVTSVLDVSGSGTMITRDGSILQIGNSGDLSVDGIIMGSEIVCQDGYINMDRPKFTVFRCVDISGNNVYDSGCCRTTNNGVACKVEMDSNGGRKGGIVIAIGGGDSMCCPDSNK